jgi:hypothetical protein
MFNSTYFRELNTTVFDIETTGLFHSRDCIINAGFCDPSGDVWQNFTEDPADEARVVEEALEMISQADAVVTYNGDTFDLPFLLRRAQKYRLCEHLPLLWSVDLYRWLKKYWPGAASMKSMSQKSVEEAFGLSERRTDEIPGGDCIPLYNYYLQTKDEKAKDTILLHNADDVRQLARIAFKCNFLPYHDIAFREGFLFKAGSRKILTKGSAFKKNALVTDVRLEKGLLPVSAYEDQYHLEYDMFTGKATLELFPAEKEGFLYVDLEKIPGAAETCKELPAFHSGYLILAENGEPGTRACNALTKAVLSAYFND